MLGHMNAGRKPMAVEMSVFKLRGALLARITPAVACASDFMADQTPFPFADGKFLSLSSVAAPTR